MRDRLGDHHDALTALAVVVCFDGVQDAHGAAYALQHTILCDAAK